MKYTFLLVAIFASQCLNLEAQETDKLISDENVTNSEQVYIAFYNQYFPTMVHLHVGDEKTVIDWVNNNWDYINWKEELSGTGSSCDTASYCWFYGMAPVLDQEDYLEENLGTFAAPKSVRELLNNKEKYFADWVHPGGNDHCLEVHTDDDEIDMIWMVFDEKYKQENWNRVALWFEDFSPDHGEKGETIEVNGSITPNGTKEGTTYFLTRSDGHQLSNNEVLEFKGLRTPDIFEHLRDTKQLEWKRDSATHKSDDENFIEILRLQEIIQAAPKQDLYFALKYLFDEVFPRHMINEHSSKVEYIFPEIPPNWSALKPTAETRNVIRKDSINNILRHVRQNSEMIYSDHFIEIKSEFENNTYFHWVIFDDLWVEKNSALAKSMLNMHMKQSILD